jgi:5-methylcytosine-specific restriction endonuclease McrA
MSVTHISAELRRLVRARAGAICEYCLIAEEETHFGCALDHIISEKHGGLTEAENLALACVYCNQAKGSDIGSIVQTSGSFVRFLNPRSDRWSDHFAIAGNRIEARSQIEEVTSRILASTSPIESWSGKCSSI